MNSFLLDAPVIVTRYTSEPGYLLIDQLFAQASPARLCCSILGLAEVVAALVRLRRGGKCPPGLFASAILQFRLDVLDRASFTKLSIDRAQVEASLALIDQHQLESNEGILLRICLDHAVSLRTAGHDLVMVSSGRRLLKVARKEGLVTFNPETQTQADLEVLLGP
jgi:hypothetical protein